MKKCRVYNSARVWRLGMWIVITVTNIVNAFGCMPVSYFQGAANDCECRGNWELIPPQFTICPPADRNLPRCPDRRVVDRADNLSCNLSLLIPPKVIRERILRYWGWVSDTECNNLNWPPDSQEVFVSLPGLGLGPCTWAERFIKWQESCFRQGYRCTDPEKVTMRFYRECNPRPDVRFGVIPDCECPDDPVIVIIEEEFTVIIKITA